MKKFIVLMAIVSMVFTFAGYAYAKEEISEKPNFKIIINGKQSKYEDVPIVVNGRTLLPLRAVLINLGIKNDTQHIIWNDSEKSVTIIDNSVKVYLKIDSKTAYVNGASREIDVAPMIYKDKTYIPARFVSQSFGKVVEWDGRTNTVGICEKEMYEKVVNILKKSDNAEVLESKYKTTSNVKLDILNIITSDSVSTSEYDVKKKLEHIITRTISNAHETVVEQYKSENMLYTKKDNLGQWEAMPQDPEDSEDTYETNIGRKSINDIMASGLVASDDTANKEIVLSGDISLNNMLNLKEDISFTGNIIVRIDNSTYLTKSIEWNMNGNSMTNELRIPYSFKLNMKFSYKEQFNIDLPKDIH